MFDRLQVRVSGMSTESIVMDWDRALRASEWDTARALLADDATYQGPDPPIDCATPDEIIDLMRSFKGVNPDVELLGLEVLGDRAVASLRQPAWDVEWYQVIAVRGDQIASLEDFPTRESALAAIS
jgi:hypothetical protein